MNPIDERNINIWELNSPKNKRDLTIKRLAIGIIGLINLAALGGALYGIVTYCSITAEALLISPFIIGVLGALIYLNFPTCGINTMNYTQYSNPLVLLGKTLTYVFFGPYMYITKKIDWTAYHDPIIANNLARDLENDSFEETFKKYKRSIPNLSKYGIIPIHNQQTLNQIYQDFKPLYKEKSYIIEKKIEWHEHMEALNRRINDIESRWATLKADILPALPHPPIPQRDFTKRFTWLRFQAKGLVLKEAYRKKS